MNRKSTSCFSKTTGEPLTEYSTESEAKRAAAYASRAYGNSMVAYKCGNCGCWHLSPKSRQTKSVECSRCVDSHGRRKQLYLSRMDAQRRADIIFRERGILLKVYKCPVAKGWHLTRNDAFSPRY